MQVHKKSENVSLHAVIEACLHYKSIRRQLSYLAPSYAHGHVQLWTEKRLVGYTEKTACSAQT